MATKITTDDIEEYLEGLGKQDSKGKVYFERVLFGTKILKSGVKIVLDSPDTEPVVKNFKSKMIKTLMGKYKGGILTKVEQTVKGINKGIDNPVIRLRYSDQGPKYIDFDVKEYPSKGKGGTLPPKISEPATMLVLNAALESKGKVFKTEEDIFVNDVYKDLEKLFGKQWGHKLDEWIYTFLHQNKLFFKNYSTATWAPFKHKDYKGKDDMQVFFKKHLKTLERSPGIKAGTYEQWNPSDLYAVKRTDQSSLEKEIQEASKRPSANNLMKLNSHLIKLMEKKELVGISLKKINSGDTPHFKVYNVDSSKLLTALKAFTELEMFDMKRINFGLRNIFGIFPGKGGAPAGTTYIWYGGTNDASSEFKIAITRSGDALVWNTFIPSAKGAQGGQTPRGEVINLLKHNASGVTFQNQYIDYPKDGEAFADIISKPNSTEYKKYKKWFTLVYKHSKNDYNNSQTTFDTWADSVYQAYEARPDKPGIVGKTKLALLNFWYDALKNHDKDPEFWTDMLYYGMKITTKGQFAPYAKIS